jgi:hypothetical protein
MSTQQLEFSARIARIESGVGSSKSTLFVGVDESYLVSYPRRGRSAGNSVLDAVGNAMYTVMIVVAFLVGVAANCASRLIDFMSNGLPDGTENIDAMMAMDFTIAMMVSSVLGVFFRIGIRDFIVLRIVGILSGMFGLHNLVHAYPDYFAQIYTQVWVSYIINTTDSPSIFWRGVSFMLN